MKRSNPALQEPTLLILTALADEPRHGYALIAEVARISNDRVKLRTGTLYAALDRLQNLGWVAETESKVVDGRNRRYYMLSRAGAERLEEEVERVRSTADEAVRRLSLRVVAA